jgi:2-polyprenyl-3-methyl-5-hydroxy-6-metoxy-1,4-benzoquinol methylase
MTCKHCCGADQFFDLKVAQKKMKNFKRKGAGSITKKLLKLLLLQDLEGKTLLDIGGGIGAIQWTFLENGGKKTTDVDASSEYLKVAEAHAIENNFNEKAHFLKGDFIDKSDEIHKHDFVTLDKVVCCYPDYKSLLGLALDKCNESIALTFPLGGPLAKFVAVVENIYFRFKKIPFGTYIHSPADIEKFIKSNGFSEVHKKIIFPWHVQVYTKVGNSE